MTKRDQQELMELMREQQRKESAECLAKAESEQLSAAEPQKLSNQEAVDQLFNQAKDVSLAPRIAYEAWQQARMKVVRLRARAEAVGGMRLSKDKVQGGQPLMLDEMMTAVWEAEEVVHQKWLLYVAARLSFFYCLDRAFRMGLFSYEQVRCWKWYYGDENRSLQQVADLLRIPQKRVWYLVCSVQAEVRWCKTVEQVIDEIDFEDEELEVG